MTNQVNKSLTMRLFDQVFNHGNPDVIDEIVGADYVDHSSLPAPAPGIDGFKKRTQMLRAAFAPAMAMDSFSAEGDLVAFAWTMRGVHQGMFANTPPTGRSISVSGINIERFKDGKIVEHWSQFDALGLLRQIGALPSPEQTPRG
jgi:predicted ester cyclase